MIRSSLDAKGRLDLTSNRSAAYGLFIKPTLSRALMPRLTTSLVCMLDSAAVSFLQPTVFGESNPNVMSSPDIESLSIGDAKATSPSSTDQDHQDDSQLEAWKD